MVCPDDVMYWSNFAVRALWRGKGRWWVKRGRGDGGLRGEGEMVG